MLARYGISPKRSASLLDTFSCIFQGIIPYGAQMLMAISTCAALGYAISAFDIIPLLFYPLEAVFFTWRFQRTAATALRHTGIAEALRREPTFLRRWALGVSTQNETLYFLSNRMNSRLDRHSRKG